ncbi:DUF402 domain-containing protein [Haladaptatus sp. GCM10025707]|uniref:DUF402 domain-containing protein n=1 Tax=unclassified Haladaptatus TaxID=2622732 RepID=UPI0023E83F3C|nr:MULTISPECIES: DUF402 domain-containing protein [unclassified Haladaptatus]
MNVRVRGIYTTAVTHLLHDAGHDVVLASEPIRNRFDEAFEDAEYDATVETTADRQGVGVVGTDEAVGELHDLLAVGIDTFSWADPAPRGAVCNVVVTETLGSGAVVDLGAAEGFLPYSKVDDRVSENDALRVQVRDPAAPWSGDRPVVDTRIRVMGGLATLVRGPEPSGTRPMALGDLLPTDPPEGWYVSWGRDADDASLDALDDALSAAVAQADAIEGSLADAPDPTDEAPLALHDGEATRWVWFGRDSRFALDDHRRAVTTTMPGHHRIKAADRRASAAVDFVEDICDPQGEFPFAAVTRQFGPMAGDTVAIGHGKPDGRLITLGSGEVTDREVDNQRITVTRKMSPGGNYDALEVPRRAGDVAVTKFTEGKWWYPTVYRSQDGDRRGTYVNVCTPVEIFPDTVRYVDLHVDVIKHADGTVERVDDDELDAAVALGNISPELAEKARRVASALEKAL